MDKAEQGIIDNIVEELYQKVLIEYKGTSSAVELEYHRDLFREGAEAMYHEIKNRLYFDTNRQR